MVARAFKTANEAKIGTIYRTTKAETYESRIRQL